MEKQIGIIEDQIRLVKKDEELIKSIVKSRGWQKDKDKINFVRESLLYNMFTVLQFSDLTGKDVVTITNLCKVEYDEDIGLHSKLDACYPFKSLEKKGPKFIYRNEKSENYLKKS